MLLGAHVSISNGFSGAVHEAAALQMTAMQIFTANQQQWTTRKVDDDDAANFKKLRAEKGIARAVAHAAYLINLASASAKVRHMSVQSLSREFERANALGLEYVIMHPGSPGEDGNKEGFKRFEKGIGSIVKDWAKGKTKLLLETNAGQGHCIGDNFEQLKTLLSISDPDLVAGICLDTCHIFAAGYDIRTVDGLKRALDECDTLLGIKSIKAIHMNDSKKDLGSRVDRHAHIGKGCIGTEPFKFLMTSKKFRDVPKIIETPKEEGMDAKNLALLRSFCKLRTDTQ